MSSKTIKLTLAQALVKYLCAQKTKIDGENLPLFAGVWANFGHGNVPAIQNTANPAPITSWVLRLV